MNGKGEVCSASFGDDSLARIIECSGSSGVSEMKKMILAAPAALVALAFSAPAFSTETKVALCEYCNSAAFRNAAEVIALQESPRLQEGVQFVFVVDIGTDEIRYYEVVREYIETCLSSTGANSAMSSGSIIDPDNPPDFPDCLSSWVTTSTQLAPPATELAEIRAALEEVDKFLAEIQDLEAGNIDFGSIFQFDSATDLIGPDGEYYDVSIRRQAFMNAVSHALTDTWLERAYWDVQSVAGAAAGKFLGEFAQAIMITIFFGDETQISVMLKGLLKDEYGNIVGFDMEIRQGSAVLPDGTTPIPVSTRLFIDLFGNPFTTTSSLLSNLSDLFVRGGGRVVQGPGRSDCLYSIACVESDVDGEPECTERRPHPSNALSCP